MSCDMDSGTSYFSPDSSHLFYLVCKFNSVVHTKCQKGAICMDYKVKFTEVKQARWVKPEFEATRSWNYITTLSMAILWLVARVDCKKRRFSGFFLIHKNHFLSRIKKKICRSLLQEIYNQMGKYKFWCYGHFKLRKNQHTMYI